MPTQGCRSRSREGSINNKVPCVSRRHFRGFEHSFISTEGDVGNSEDVFSTTLEHDPGTALRAIALPRNFVVSTVTQFTGSTGHLQVFARRTCGTGQDDSGKLDGVVMHPVWHGVLSLAHPASVSWRSPKYYFYKNALLQLIQTLPDPHVTSLGHIVIPKSPVIYFIANPFVRTLAVMGDQKGVMGLSCVATTSSSRECDMSSTNSTSTSISLARNEQ